MKRRGGEGNKEQREFPSGFCGEEKENSCSCLTLAAILCNASHVNQKNTILVLEFFKLKLLF